MTHFSSDAICVILDRASRDAARMWMFAAIGCAYLSDPKDPAVAWQRILEVQPMLPALVSHHVRSVDYGWLGPCVMAGESWECDDALGSLVWPVRGIEGFVLRFREDRLTMVEIWPVNSCQDAMCFGQVSYARSFDPADPPGAPLPEGTLDDGWVVVIQDY